MEIEFNDIRTTLQALLATFDNAQSLHTNAYDEAITTPTERVVRRAMAIQLIINKEFGLAFCENAIAGQLHRRGAHGPGRGGGARRVRPPDRARRRARRDGAPVPARQDPGRLAEVRDAEALRRAADRRREHVHCRATSAEAGPAREVELSRASTAEKDACIARLRRRSRRGTRRQRRRRCSGCRRRPRRAATSSRRCSTSTEHCSLGQITHALYEVGGEYRRNI